MVWVGIGAQVFELFGWLLGWLLVGVTGDRVLLLIVILWVLGAGLHYRWIILKF